MLKQADVVFTYRNAQKYQEKPVSRWPVAGPSKYWLQASSLASKVKNSKIVQNFEVISNKLNISRTSALSGKFTKEK